MILAAPRWTILATIESFGFDALDARADHEDYIRRYKQIFSH